MPDEKGLSLECGHVTIGRPNDDCPLRITKEVEQLAGKSSGIATYTTDQKDYLN